MTTPALGTPTASTPTAHAAGTVPAPVPHRAGGPRRWWDRVIAADPGLGNLQAGWRSLVSMSVSLAVGYGMSEALRVPAMLGMVVAGMMGLMSAFAVAENTAGRLARAILWMPLPYSAVLPLTSVLHPDRVLELSLMVMALALAFFLVRFGTLGLLTGMMMFNAFMVGVMTDIPLRYCGDLFAIALVTSVAVLAARLLLCHPMPRRDLLRTQRAFLVEARRALEAAATALDPDAAQATAVHRMRRALRRLNITTVTIDGHLAQPEVAADPDMAELLHQYLFDAELALQGIGQAVSGMTGRHVPARLREALVVGLVIARDAHLGRADALRPAAELVRRKAADAPQDISAEEAEVRALARRVGDLLDAFADALACWLSLGWNSPTARARVPFQPTVALERNRPAGTGPAAQRVADAQAGRGWRRAVPHLRAPLHAGIAAALVCPIADAINGTRFYWGLVGVMITLFGTNTTHERLRKLGHRMVGTVAGAVLGIALLRLIGTGHAYATLAVIVIALSFGSWGIQRSYAYWVVGLVTALVQMYALTVPARDMDWLLTERLLDNALGMLVATGCAAVVFPVSTRRVAREAKRGYLAALEDLVARVATRWKDPEAPVRLRGAARAVDAALLQVQSVVRPLVRMPLGVRGRGGDNLLALLGTATRHAHALAAAADIDIDLAAPLRERVERITDVLARSLRALDRHLATDEPGGTWVRVSPMIRELQSALHGPDGPRAGRLQTALDELAALDEVLASLADIRGLEVATAPEPAAVTGTPAGRGAGGTEPGAVTVRTAGRPAPPAPARPAGGPTETTAATTTVSGALHCAAHPGGCDAWITVVTDRGKRRAMVRATGGHYRIPDLAPGGYTLVASGPAHAPRAEFLLVGPSGGEVRHDITLPGA